MSFQYTVLGFELKTFGVSSHNHYTRAPTLWAKILDYAPRFHLHLSFCGPRANHLSFLRFTLLSLLLQFEKNEIKRKRGRYWRINFFTIMMVETKLCKRLLQGNLATSK